jgi:hypothetical protein
MSLRAKILVVAVASSCLTWFLWFQVTRYTYQQAHQAGIIPNLHVRDHIKLALEGP